MPTITDYNAGPVNVYLVLAGGGLVDIGPTQGGVSISIILDTVDILYDEDGTLATEQILAGVGGTVKLPLTAITWQKLLTAIPGSELQYVPSGRLYVGNSVGASLSTYSIRLLLKRIDNGVETTDALSPHGPNWITLLKAAPVDPGPLSYGMEQQIMEVTFQLYPDSTVLSPSGAASIIVFGTPPGVVGGALGCDAGFFQGIQIYGLLPSHGDVFVYDSFTEQWIAGPPGGSAWDLDGNDDLMPKSGPFTSTLWTLDGNDDLMPVLA